MVNEVFPKLYSSPMMYDGFVWDRKAGFYSFVITEHTSDREYMKRSVAEMLTSGACGFCFFGDYAEEWAAATNEIVTEQDITIKVCEYEVDFAQFMYECMTVAEKPACEIAFVYDEEVTYHWVIHKVEWLMQQAKLFHVVRMCLDELNPYGLLPEAPADEFYGEASKIVDILRPGDTVDVVAGKMVSVLNQTFDLTFTSDLCMGYAVRIVDSMSFEIGE